MRTRHVSRHGEVEGDKFREWGFPPLLRRVHSKVFDELFAALWRNRVDLSGYPVQPQP